MNHALLAVPEHPECDRLHWRPAEVGSVPGMYVHVAAPQAMWAVIAMAGPVSEHRNRGAAVDAHKGRPHRGAGSKRRFATAANGRGAAHRNCPFLSSRENFAICLPNSRARCLRISAVV